MEDNRLDRRYFLKKLGISCLAGIAGLTGAVSNVRAAGKKNAPQGIWEVTGDVRINGKPARKGMLVNPGDVITTGAPESRAVFVLGQDAFMLRANTELELEKPSAGDQVADFMRVINGKVMAVFGKGEKRISTPTAVAGIRGTGVYIEATPSRTYFCTCYGITDIRAKASPEARKTIKSVHHDSPLYIRADGDPGSLFADASAEKNHTDAELIFLESLVGRKPPFDQKKYRDHKKSRY